MCGIVGWMEFSGRPVDPRILDAMVGSLSHRGPEGRGTRILKAGTMGVGLGHTRLKIIDLSEQAAQPMENEDGSVVLVFNGEIYNFRQLRDELESRGVRFRTSSDTEVILRLYQTEGDRCVQRLEGMFAFAIWDGRRNLLFLARDRMGKKPLFTVSTPQRFAFASETKALHAHPEIPMPMDTEVLPPFFHFGYVPTPRTFYRNVLKLAPAHWMKVHPDGRLETEAYWELSLPRDEPRLSAPPSWSQARQRLRELIFKAVERRLISDVPLGAFLSGGLDSSIVVAAMSRFRKEPIRTFSIGFSGDRRFDETPYARLISRRFGTTHQELVVEPTSVDLVEKLVWHHDGPFADSSAIPTYLLCRLTRDHVTVALTGDGGDELFAGYDRFYGTLLSERIPLIWRRWGDRFLSRLPEWGGYRGPLRRLKRFSAASHLPFIERYSRWVGVFYEDLLRLLGQGMVRNTEAELSAWLHPVLERCTGASPLTQLLYLNLKTYLLDDLLVKMDRCSMAHALEARSPFLDRELVEYVFSLPDEMKLRWGRTKVLLREAFAAELPRAILRRPKMGFGVPLETWFRGGLGSFIQDHLLSPQARLRQYVEGKVVRQLVSDHIGRKADYSHRIWTLLTFEIWLRQQAGSRSGRSVEPVPSPA